MTLPNVFASLRASIELEAGHYHPAAQAARFLGCFALTLALQVMAGAPLTGWADLRSLLAGAVPVALRQWRKTMPVAAVHRALDEHEADITVAPPPIGPRW